MSSFLPLGSSEREPLRFRLSGEAQFFTALGSSWLLYALLFVCAALAWRFAGESPQLRSVLDGAGLALWAAALLIVPAWQRMLQSQERHCVPAADSMGTRFVCALRLLQAALMLALCPASLLLAFDSRVMLAELSALDAPELLVPFPLFLLVILVFMGTATALGSFSLLLWLRRLGGMRYGTLLWLFAALLLHLPLLSGRESSLLLAQLPAIDRALDVLNTLSNTNGWHLHLEDIFSLGRYGDFVQRVLANENATLFRIGQYATTILLPPLLLLALHFGMLLSLQSLAAARPSRISAALPPAWFAAAASLLAAALCAVLQLRLWMESAAVRFPADWLGLPGLALLTLLNVLWITLWQQPGRGRSIAAALPWLLLTVPAVLLLSRPSIVADQSSPRELLLAAALHLLLLCSSVLLLLRSSWLRDRLSPLWGTVLMGLMLLLFNLPLFAGLSPLLALQRALTTALLDRGFTGAALYITLLLIALCLVLWPWRGRLRRPALKPAGAKT